MAAKEFTKLGTERAHLEVAWQDRLADAQALLAAGRHAAAIAAAIYALEIRLKVLICRKLELPQLPRAFEIHELDALLLLAGLSERLKRRGARKPKKSWERIIPEAAKLNDLRYLPASNWTAAESTALMTWLNDPTEGMFPWLSKQR